MYFKEQQTILIHVPKTAGNSITTALLKYSSDHMILRTHQDGKDRFEVRGDITPNKHATLQDYYNVLGKSLFEHKIVVTARNPIDRAISLYFSPSENLVLPTRARLIKAVANSLGVDVSFEPEVWTYKQPSLSIEVFMEFVRSSNTICDCLRVNDELVAPHLVIHQENLSADYSELLRLLGLPQRGLSQHVNKSAANRSAIVELRENPLVQKVCKEVFREDFEFLPEYVE